MVNRSWNPLLPPSQPLGKPEELRDAIVDLESLVKNELPSSGVADSPLARMIDLGRRLISACFAKVKVASRRDNTQERLINAIGVIKAHYLQASSLDQNRVSTTESKIRSVVPSVSSSKVALVRMPWRDLSAPLQQATSRELDLFRVKAISLIRKYVSQSNLLAEALEAIRKTPIVPSLSKNGEMGTITLTQTIQLFPDCFVLEGSFQRNAHSKVPSIPLSGSFRVNSLATSYLRPLLHNGWALSESFLPTLSKLDVATPTLAALLTKKRQVATLLQVGGEMVHKAKQLIANKQLVFQQDVAKYVELHRQLALQIALSGGEHVSTASPIDAYFDWLSKQPDAYEQISQLYDVLNEVFLGNTSQQNAWAEVQDDHPATQFIAYLGPILARGGANPTSLLGRQMLHALYQQLRSFHRELYQEVEPSTFSARMTESLIADRRCFETDPLESVSTIPQQAVAEHLALLFG